MTATARQLLIVTLAEYQTEFWINVARALEGSEFLPAFLSFDDRSSEMIRAIGFRVVSASAIDVPAAGERASLFARVGIDDPQRWLVHERFAFAREDETAMLAKLAWSITAAEQAIEQMSRDGVPVIMLQEVGGFLSVVGSYFAARAAGIDNWFIEPSFFRGRVVLTRNTFAAPRVSTRETEVASPGEMRAYIDHAMAMGTIVIPAKDAHHYSSAMHKILNRRNVRRLFEKARDKYLLGKRQEFGFIGHHVLSHLRMILNSWRLRNRYTVPNTLDRYIYYPLHVPGDMALTLRSPEYLDQLSLIDRMCELMPDGYRLAIKEHPAMIGALPAGRLIELIERQPKLALLPPASNNYGIMRRAAAVVSVNSKSGAEAGLLGKTVFVLGDAFFADAPFAVRADLSTLPLQLAAMAANPPADRPAPAALDFFARVWTGSRPGELFVPDVARGGQFAQAVVELLAPDHVGDVA